MNQRQPRPRPREQRTGIDRRQRQDYTPGVRPRSAREEGTSRLRPDYLNDLSDTKIKYSLLETLSTNRFFLVAGIPAKGKRLRIISITVIQESTDGRHLLEIYFGNEANITGDADNAIDILAVPDLGSASTRSWGRGAGPVGVKDERLSARWTSAPATNHHCIIEYTEES